MTHPWVDLSVIVPENRRVTHVGRSVDFVRSDRVRSVPVPVRTKPSSMITGFLLSHSVSLP